MGNLPCFVGIDPGYKTGAVALITENGLRYMTYLFGKLAGSIRLSWRRFYKV